MNDDEFDGLTKELGQPIQPAPGTQVGRRGRPRRIIRALRGSQRPGGQTDLRAILHQHFRTIQREELDSVRVRWSAPQGPLLFGVWSRWPGGAERNALWTQDGKVLQQLRHHGPVGTCPGGGGNCDNLTFNNCSGTSISNCFCFTSAEGTAVCGCNTYCSSAPGCPSTADCGAGRVCIVSTGCGLQLYARCLRPRMHRDVFAGRADPSRDTRHVSLDCDFPSLIT